MRTTTLCLFAGALLVPAKVQAGHVPLPPVRPAIEHAAMPSPPAVPVPRPRAAEPTPRAAPAAAGRSGVAFPALPDSNATACTDLLAGDIATIEQVAAISALSGEAVCGDQAPVRMSAVRLQDGGTVELRPAVVARCEMALAFARWVHDDVGPAAAREGAALERIDIAASYVCRPRNNVEGGQLSEHGRANAVDVRAVALADGRTFTIENSDAPASLLAEMRRSACERFTTVLGPGADAAHADHIHLDLRQRRGGYRLCQWNLPDSALP